MSALTDGITDVLLTAEACAQNAKHLPSLILSYSAIDAMSWLYTESESEPVNTRFKAWVDRYLLPAAPRLRCTSEELYAARCGILHRFTAESSLSARGTRMIIYAWGTASPEQLNPPVDPIEQDRWVTVHIADLNEGIRLGTAQMFEDAEGDGVLRQRIKSRGEAYYENVPLKPQSASGSHG